MRERICLLLARIVDCKISPETIGQFISRKTILISATLRPMLARWCALVCATGDSTHSICTSARASISLNPLAAFKLLYISLGTWHLSSIRVWHFVGVRRADCRNRSRLFRRICIRKLSNSRSTDSVTLN